MENELKQQPVVILHKGWTNEHTRTVWNLHLRPNEAQVYGQVRDQGRMWLVGLRTDGKWELYK